MKGVSDSFPFNIQAGRGSDKNKKMKAVNILWDIDENEANGVELPSEIEIPEDIARVGDMDEISDYLSELTGYCHYGFELED